jgi:hypothetical protein
MNAQIQNIETNGSQATNVGARKVNVSAGTSRGDLSTEWIARPADQKFLSLDALRASVQKRRDTSSEVTIPTKKIEFNAPEIRTIADTHKLTVGLPNGIERPASNWAFGQIAGLAKFPAAPLRELPSPLVADILSYRMHHARDVEDVKLYHNADALMCATGPDYGRIFDAEVVEAVQQIAGNGTGESRWKVPGVLDWRTHIYDPNAPVTLDTTTLFASDRDVFMFLVDDRNPIEIGKLADGSPDYVFRGFYVTNSEMGKGAMKVCAFYLRAICCNRIMWGVEGFEEVSLRHSKHAPARFIEEVRPALNSFGDAGTLKLVEGVQKAKAAKLAADDEEALDFLRKRDFSKSRAKSILETVEREEQHPARTAWDFAQGITALARNELNTDTRLELELEARKLLDKVAA